MAISIQRTTTGTEPLLLTDAKSHLAVSITDDDTLITALITAARQRAESITGRTLVASTYTYWLDSFPYLWYEQCAPARNSISKVMSWWANAQVIQLPHGPVQSVSSIKYLQDNSGNYTTLDPSNYTADTSSEPCVVYPIANAYWPQVWAIHNCVQISYTAGYPAVPEDIKLAMKLMIGAWYQQREDSADVPKAAEYILASYRSMPCGVTGR